MSVREEGGGGRGEWETSIEEMSEIESYDFSHLYTSRRTLRA